MTALAEFLLDRIAEDETHWGDPLLAAPGALEIRMVAECVAKRRIVSLHQVGDPDEWSPDLWACRLCQWDEDCDAPKHDHQHGAGRFPCDTLRALAQVYAGHPAYRAEWSL